MERLCEVPGCLKPRSGAGLCLMHYTRMRRHGDLGDAQPQRLKRSGCLVEGCGRVHKAKGYCSRHYMNLLRTGDPSGVGTRTGEQSPHWVVSPTYHGMHSRIRTQRGRASSYVCGCGEPAQQWAYNHLDSNEAHEVVGGYLLPYSMDPNFYDALCTYCHRHRDVNRSVKEPTQ
jgi:hypothetical protein